MLSDLLLLGHLCVIYGQVCESTFARTLHCHTRIIGFVVHTDTSIRFFIPLNDHAKNLESTDTNISLDLFYNVHSINIKVPEIALHAPLNN